jgi:hypothetical protein
MGAPHVLAGGCSKLDVGGQARDEGRGAAARASGQGVASGLLGDSHSR